ncbi:hypothetical protein [Propionivibrio sp.]|uniref:hypothetical protein n=1 Tax=Propionivibrio sp. TaxID=2212460 RepID=UPI003BF5537A
MRPKVRPSPIEQQATTAINAWLVIEPQFAPFDRVPQIIFGAHALTGTHGHFSGEKLRVVAPVSFAMTTHKKRRRIGVLPMKKQSRR